jgi:NAD(P)-dependent dehydrogenase (short-subunit alcohol dehydrogenase family)
MNPQPLDLSGKRILVTGASSGIGRTTSQLLARLGARVALLARDEARLQQTLDSLAGSGHSMDVFDLAAIDEIPALLKRSAKEQGPLAGLFHCAGVGTIIPVSILKGKYIDPVLDVSIKAALLLTRGFCQKGVHKEGPASIVFMSSISSLCGVKGLSIYSASKAAIDGAVRALACELAPRGIRVNSIAGGAVETGLHSQAVGNLNEDEIAEYREKHLLGFGSPEDIAYAAAFLLSDAAKWITGTTMVVDGGYSCT